MRTGARDGTCAVVSLLRVPILEAMRTTIALAITLFSFVATAQVQMPATTRVGIGQLQTLAHGHSDAKKLTQIAEGLYPAAFVHGRCMVGFLGKVNSAFNQDQGGDGAVVWGARIGNIISFRVDAQQLALLQSILGLDYVELAGKASPDLSLVISDIRADSVHRGIQLPQAYTGKDVLIGITDWGFDYTHPMFYDTTLSETRVRAAWDQYKQAGPSPAAYGYGTEMTTTEALLAAGSDTANIYSYATHGSHVAGIAGGSGAGTVNRGVAFEAKYLFCTFLIDGAAVLDAFAWMKEIAAQDDKRLVINMSWGLHWIGTLDGNSLISQAIDQLSEEGVVFVNSAGNNGDVPFHIKKQFASDTLRSRIQFYPYTANPNTWGQSISMWGEPGASFAAGFMVLNNSSIVLQESPWYSSATAPTYLDSFLVQGVDTVFFNLTTEASHPLNGRPHFRLRIKSRSNQIRIGLKATAPSNTVHFWNVTELTTGVGNWGQGLVAARPGWVAGDAQYSISEPACTESLISVAAYSSSYFTGGGNLVGGAAASFTSYGPTLDERIKPDIAAPGVNVASSISSFTDNDVTAILTVPFQGRNYPFARFSGTSMASPAVAGVVALMLEADPTLTPAEIKEIIQLTARTDNNTGVIPPGGSTRWGMGKVNAYHAIRQALGLTSVNEVSADPFMIWPNPVTAELNVLAPADGGKVRIRVLDVTGRLITDHAQNTGGLILLDASKWSAGVYQVIAEQGSGRSVSKVVKP